MRARTGATVAGAVLALGFAGLPARAVDVDAPACSTTTVLPFEPSPTLHLTGQEFITFNIWTLNDPENADQFIELRSAGISAAQKEFAGMGNMTAVYLKQGTYGKSDPVQTPNLVYGDVAAIAIFRAANGCNVVYYETLGAWFQNQTVITEASAMVNQTWRVVGADTPAAVAPAGRRAVVNKVEESNGAVRRLTWANEGSGGEDGGDDDCPAPTLPFAPDAFMGLDGNEMVTINIWTLNNATAADEFIGLRAPGIKAAQEEFKDVGVTTAVYIKQGTYGVSDPVQTPNLVYGDVAALSVNDPFDGCGTKMYETLGGWFTEQPTTKQASAMVNSTWRVIGADAAPDKRRRVSFCGSARSLRML